ncbi:hypothetical protein AGOR_G00098780 [Albula goreensis]|uniref:ZP domain-containing protein n=1 Tax=Albula goreensis TaxID=1534307 RepID=A0A8T3DPD6_9TELE|nr:hypothetical protein AGOR_G00098780 [Albula goreensis]
MLKVVFVFLLLGCLPISANEMEETEETDDFWQEWESSSVAPTITPKHWGPAMTPAPLRSPSPTPSPVPSHQTENAKSHKELKMVLNSENKATIPDVFKKAILPSTEESDSPAPAKKGPVEARCHLDRMYMRVRRSILSGRYAWKYLSFGSCPVNKVTRAYFYFLYDLNKCGLIPQSTDDAVVFTGLIRYERKTTGKVVRKRIIEIPVTCRFTRYHRVYKLGFYPVLGPTHHKDLPTKLGPSLVALDENWAPLGSGGHYTLEDAMYFEVRLPVGANQRVFVSECHITASPESNSVPRFNVIENSGCMVDSKDSDLSQYHSYSDRSVLRFTFGTFLFPDLPREQTHFLHCTVNHASDATPWLKACTYNKKTQMWEELYSTDIGVCTCCNSLCPRSAHSLPPTIASSEPLKMEIDETDLQVETLEEDLEDFEDLDAWDLED